MRICKRLGTEAILPARLVVLAWIRGLTVCSSYTDHGDCATTLTLESEIAEIVSA